MFLQSPMSNYQKLALTRESRKSILPVRMKTWTDGICVNAFSTKLVYQQEILKNEINATCKKLNVCLKTKTTHKLGQLIMQKNVTKYHDEGYQFFNFVCN